MKIEPCPVCKSQMFSVLDYNAEDVSALIECEVCTNNENRRVDQKEVKVIKLADDLQYDLDISYADAYDLAKMMITMNVDQEIKNEIKR